jgi:hypothetical protein
VLKQVLPWRSLNSAAEIDPSATSTVQRKFFHGGLNSGAEIDPQERFTRASDCERESYNLSVLSVYFWVTPP